MLIEQGKLVASIKFLWGGNSWTYGRLCKLFKGTSINWLQSEEDTKKSSQIDKLHTSGPIKLKQNKSNAIY